MPHCWVALGYGGNGITYSRIAADVIAGALTGRPDVDADLYGFKKSRESRRSAGGDSKRRAVRGDAHA